MATYIQGVQGYYTQIQPFTPDYNMMGTVLAQKQGSYDAAWNRVNSVYGSLLNSPMLRDSNIATRDEFFKIISQDIKALDGVDLSIKDNETAARSLFTQIEKNPNIKKDIAFTSQYMKGLRDAESFRNCRDPKACGGSYWDGGVKSLNYRALDFKNATDEEALNMKSPRYVPYQNVLEKAQSLVKEFGLKIENETLSPDGRYRIKTVNGQQVAPVVYSMLEGMLAKDPSVVDYYKEQGYLQRKDWVSENLPYYGNSERDANAAYYTSMVTEINSRIKKEQNDINNNHAKTTAKVEAVREDIKNNGYFPGSPLAQMYDDLNKIHQVEGETVEVYKQKGLVLDSVISKGINNNSLESLDELIGSFKMKLDLMNSAMVLSMIDSSVSIKEDEYGVLASKHRYDVSMEAIKNKYASDLKDKDYQIFEKKELLKYSLGHSSYREGSGSGGSGGTKLMDQLKVASKDPSHPLHGLAMSMFAGQGLPSQGSSEVPASDQQSIGERSKTVSEEINSAYDKQYESMMEDTKEVTMAYLSDTLPVAKREKGIGAATADLIDLVDDLSKRRPSGFNVVANIGGRDVPWDQMSSDDKANTVKGVYDSNIKNYLSGDTRTVSFLASNSYDKISKSMDMNDPVNFATKKYLMSASNRTQAARVSAQVKKSELTMLNDTKATITASMTLGLTDTEKPFFDAIWDARNLKVKSKSEFSADLMSNPDFLSTVNNSSVVQQAVVYFEGYSAPKGLSSKDIMSNRLNLAIGRAKDVASNTTEFKLGSKGDMVKEIMNSPDFDGSSQSFRNLLVKYVGNAAAGSYYDSNKLPEKVQELFGEAASRTASVASYSPFGVGKLSAGASVTGFINVSDVSNPITTDFLSFTYDVMRVPPNNQSVLFSDSYNQEIGKVESNPKLGEIYKKYFADVAMGKTRNDVLRYEFNSIAGGSSKWSSNKVLIPRDYLVSEYGKNSEEVSLAENGIVIYMNEDVATNSLLKNTRRSPLEISMTYNGSAPISGLDPQYIHDAKIETVGQNTYSVSYKIADEIGPEGIIYREEVIPAQYITDLNSFYDATLVELKNREIKLKSKDVESFKIKTP